MLLSLALMALLVLAALSAALLSIGGAEVQIAANHLRGTQAHFLAEAGIEDAFSALRAEPGRLSAAPARPTAVPGLAGPGPALAPFGTYTVSYRAAGPLTVRVTSTGATATGSAQRTLRVTVSNQFTSDVAVLTERDLAIHGAARILGRCGSVHANNHLRIAGGRAEVEGRATASGAAEGAFRTPSPPGRAVAEGGQPRVPMARIDALRVLRAAQGDPVAGGALFMLTRDGRALRWNASARAFEPLEDQATPPSSRAILRGRRPGWEWSPTPGRPARWQLREDARPSGTFYVEGDVEVSASSGPGGSAGTWQATLVAAGGSIRIHGTPRLSAHLPGVVLAADRNVVLAGHGAPGSLDYEGLVLARERIDVGGNSAIRGALVAAHADISGDATIAYDCDAAPPLEGPLRILAWGS